MPHQVWSRTVLVPGMPKFEVALIVDGDGLAVQLHSEPLECRKVSSSYAALVAEAMAAAASATGLFKSDGRRRE